MKRIIKLVLAGVVLSFLVACANTGNQQLAKMDSTGVAQRIKEGVTTKAEVKQVLGQASDVDFDSFGNEKWTYVHLKSTTKASSFVPVVSLFSYGTNDTRRKLVIVFNGNDVVSKYTYSKSQGETTAGILG